MTNRFILNFLGITLFAFSLASCGDDSSPKIEEPDAIIVNNVNPNSFSATITGMFSGISKTDLALGKSGILYCETSADAESIFKAWKGGKDNVNCQIYTEGKNVSDTYTGTITGLLPETEYSFCLFSQGKDKTNREISAVHKFTTVAFNPQFSEPRVENIYYFDATAAGSLKMSSEELASCSAGFAVSKTETVSIDNSELFIYDGTDLAHLSVKLENLTDNTDYYCSMFVKFPTVTGGYDYKVGPARKFTTRDLMNTAIDLALPSGIRWAAFDMGEYDFGSSFDQSPVYYWACGDPMVVYLSVNGNTARYEMTTAENVYYDKNAGTYSFLAREISGTQYDPVHKKYGGKWRMPTKADMEELIENCSVSSRKQKVKDNVMYIPDFDAYINDYVYYYELKGTNGNIAKFRLYTRLWTGTMVDESDYPSSQYEQDPDYWKDCIYTMYISSGTPQLSMMFTTRGSTCAVRPVWDPNMVE